MSWMDRRKSNKHRYAAEEAAQRSQSSGRKLTAEALLSEIDAGNEEILSRVEEEGTIIGEKLEQHRQAVLEDLRESRDKDAWLADLRAQLKAGFAEESRASEEQFEVVRTKLSDLFEDQKEYIDEKINGMTDSISAGRAQVLETIAGNKADLLGKFDELAEGRAQVLETIAGNKADLLGKFDELADGRAQVLETIAGNKADLLEKFDELADGRQQVLDTIVGNKMDVLGKFDQVSEEQKAIEKILCEKIHSSSVKNYRNIQSLIEEQSSKAVTANLDASSIQEINRSFGGLKAMAFISCIGGLCGIAALAYLVCSLAGLI